MKKFPILATHENMLWSTIAFMWNDVPGGDKLLRRALQPASSGASPADLAPAIAALGRRLGQLTDEGLRWFCVAFDQALYTLDREDIAAHVNLKHDGFLEARARIVLLGEEHYRDVLKDPACAVPGSGLGDVLALVKAEWMRRFSRNYPSFGVAVASGSNPAGWPRVVEDQARKPRIAAAVGHLAGELRLRKDGRLRHNRPFIEVSIPRLPPHELAVVLHRLARLAKREAERAARRRARAAGEAGPPG